MIYWLVVLAVLYCTMAIMFRGAEHGPIFTFIFGVSFIVIIPIIMFDYIGDATAEYCAKENIEERREALDSLQKQNIRSLREYGINDKTINTVRIWKDMINDEKEKINNCYVNAEGAMKYADFMLLSDWVRDRIPKHLIPKKAKD